MANQLSAHSASFSSILDVIEARLRAAFPLSGFVRTCAAPNERLSQYVAQAGLLVRVRTIAPFPLHGAGRYSMQAYRMVDVVVLTQSLVDAVGDDDKAVRAHCSAEETVIDTLHLLPPVGNAASTRVGVKIELVEGGADILRELKTDPGMITSVLSFRVQYAIPCTVNRD